MTTTKNNEHKKLNFSSEREQSQVCLNSAEHEKNQGRKVLNVPNLRFPEFRGEWEEHLLGNISDVTKLAGFEFTKYVTYEDPGSIIAIRGLNCKNGSLDLRDVKYIDNSDFSKLSRSKLYVGDILYTYVGTVGEVAVVDKNDKYYLAPNVSRIRLSKDYNSDFIKQLLGSKKFYNKIVFPLIATSSQPALSMENLRRFKLRVPSIKEQKKIASLFNAIDEHIATQNKIIDKLQSLIKGIRNDVFGKLRKNIGFNAVVGDVLDYEQPQPYIVENTEYTAEGIPVLTANKAFVLGYTSETNGIYDKGDCIIFDDFTLDCKYVDFPFKVKSSAIKILTAKNKKLLRYTFEFLKYLDLSTEEHKRHYIAETQNQGIILPTEQMVKTIAHIFSTLSLRMETAVKQRNVFEKQKQYLLRQMFI